MSYEKLRVYQAARHLRLELDRLRPHLQKGFDGLYSHVDDAVDSVANNIAEGAESIYPGKRRSFYDVSAGSCREARGGVKSLSERGAFGEVSTSRFIALTFLIEKMLRALIDALPVVPSKKARVDRRRFARNEFKDTTERHEVKDTK